MHGDLNADAAPSNTIADGEYIPSVEKMTISNHYIRSARFLILLEVKIDKLAICAI